jgi:hypothetical protein
VIDIFFGVGRLSCHRIYRVYLPPVTSANTTKLPERSVSLDLTISRTGAL